MAVENTILLVSLSHEGLTRLDVQEVVDKDIEEFSQYFCDALQNDGLSRPEVAILKTYLHFKLFGPVKPT